ncbi:Condensin complex subunit [Tulasnella sp. 425]|nr:Condensin complex subunit [Tulasnella sp. 425]
MAPQFNLQEELQQIANPQDYIITNEVDATDDDALAAALEHAVEATAVTPENILESEVLDEYRSLLKHSQSLRGSQMSKLLDSITSGTSLDDWICLQAEIDAAQRDIDADDHDSFPTHRQILDVYAFLIHWFAMTADKAGSKSSEDVVVASKPKRGKGTAKTSRKASANHDGETFTWTEQIVPTLALISKLLRIKSHRIWLSTAERDTFINCVTQPVYHVMENETLMKSESIRNEAYKLICLAVKNHGHAFGAQTSMIQCLQYFEHLAEPIAEILTLLKDQFDHTQLAEGILREISGKTFNAQDTKSPRSFSRFLIRLTDLSPLLVRKQLSLLLAHIDSESYPMRMAIIEIVGALIKDIAMEEETQVDAQKKENRINALFDLLFERTLDLNSYVRAKVLNTFSRLCDLPVKFPKQRQDITKHVVAMLQDKSSSVRRYAIALLTKLILTHPFGLLHGGPLNLTEWEGRYDTVVKELKEMEKNLGMGVTPDPEGTQAEEGETEKKEGEDTEEQSDDEEADGDDDDDADAAEVAEAMEEDEEEEPVEKAPKKEKAAKKARQSLPVDLANVTDEHALRAFDAEKHVKLKLIKKYVADALAFIRQVEGASDTLSQLLVSTSKAEVLESMEFFKTAHEYEMECAEVGITKMIHLIWTKDNSATSAEDGKELKGIRSKLVEVYRLLYFDPLPDLEPKQQVNRIAKNMIERTYGATLAELTSLEELMRSLMADGQIHQDVINKLWHVYSVEREIPRCQRRGAIIILGMIALAKPEVVSERLETLLKVGLGRFGKADLVLARYTCIALQRLGGSTKKVKGSLTDKSIRFPMEHPLFRKLQDAIEHPSHSMDWFGMAEQAVNTIYLLGEQPDSLCTTLLRDFTLRAFNPKPKATTQDATGGSQAMDEDREEPEAKADPPTPPSPSKTEATEQPGEQSDLGDSFHLSQLLFLVGHVAIKHIVHLELVERDLKRRKDEGAKEKQAKNAGKAHVEELDQIVGNAEDDIGDHIADVREREMLYGPNSILATFGPMIDPTLRNAATLALSKLMCVSSRFCEENLLLLFKIVETSKDANIRGNIVIALGDIAVCFNNMIDENSDNLYRGLTDKDLNVKKNTLMVLTHLILNGMIKVKGQLGEMAKCLEDEDTRIVDLAKLFFTELSTKDNAIYNNLPDVISHLSVGEHAVDEETFQSTMKYIFNFIEKEKQAESIVEKLCQRFRLTEEPRQWQDIAFCLSLLPFKSERSMKKLIEGLPFYQDKLHNEVVFTRFSEILAKARSNKSSNKPDSELKEFETILQEHREKGEEDQALEKTMKKKADQAKKRATRRGATRRQRATTPDDAED